MAGEAVAAGRGSVGGRQEVLAVCLQGLRGPRDTHSVSRTWAAGSARSEGEEAPQQQLSERPGVWSVPHQWGVQLWLRMKASKRERED